MNDMIAILITYALGGVLAIVGLCLMLSVRGMKKRCTLRVTGIVEGYSAQDVGDEIHLPLVGYDVNGKHYNVAGPRFKGASGSVVTTLKTSLQDTVETNLTDRDHLPDWIHYKIYKSPLGGYHFSPLVDLYPVGSTVDVFCDPNKPSLAYVQRYLPPVRHAVGLALLLSGVGCIAFIVIIQALFLD